MRLGGPSDLLTVSARPILVRPTPAAREAARRAPAAAVAPAFLQLDHLRAAATDPENAGSVQLGVAARIAGDLDIAAMTAAVTDFVRAHDGLRTWFALDAGRCTRHILAPDDVEFETEPMAGPADTAWASALIAHFELELSPFTWPGIGFAALPGDDGFDVVFVADHAVSDGISQALAARELADRYRAHRDGGVSPWPARNPGSNAGYAREEYIRAEDRADELVPHWHRALADTGFRLPPPGPEHPEIVPGQRYPRRFDSEVLLEPEVTRRFEETLARAEIKPSVALFAALALTDHAHSGRRRYTAVNVVATRSGSYATAQGWFCNFVPVTFPIEREPDFDGTAAAARAGLDQCRALAALPAHAALARLLASGQADEIVTREPGFVTLLDAERLGESPEADIRLFSGEGLTSTVSIWLVRADTYSIVFGAPDIPAVRTRLAEYADALRRTLTTIAVTGDYRPSAFIDRHETASAAADLSRARKGRAA